MKSHILKIYLCLFREKKLYTYNGEVNPLY